MAKIIDHVTPPGGNVFADLGFSSEEATALKQDSERRIKADLKVQLMEEVSRVLLERTEISQC